jgi:para-aminobenzoate synthetase/4-amino-4-deoxychorismate lyase
VETLRWEKATGFLLLARHLARLAASARSLGFVCDSAHLARQLHTTVPPGSAGCKVRLVLAADGSATITTQPLPARRPLSPAARVALADTCIDPREPLLYHKTTWRPWYDGVLEQHPGCLDVLFCNGHGEVTEGTIHNLIIERNGRLVTPPIACGLLPGTLRGDLLARGLVVEEKVTREELRSARRLWLINSVRGWRRVVLA